MENGIIVLGLLLVAGLLYFIVRRYGWLGLLFFFVLVVIGTIFGRVGIIIAIGVYFLIRYLTINRQ